MVNPLDPKIRDSGSDAGEVTRIGDDKLDADHFLFRRQFALGSRYLDSFPGWLQVPIATDLFLTAHPDLEVEQVVDGSASLTLLGFMLNHERPLDSNREIIADLILRIRNDQDIADLIGATSRLSGRWALIARVNDRVSIFHDPTGLRQVHFTNSSSSGEFWCASQPALLARVLDLEPQDARLGDLLDCYTRGDGEYWFPGDLTPYQEISQLLPNHALDVRTGNVWRYWPDAPLGSMASDAAVQAASEILSGSLLAASHRFPLAVSITAGIDSRVILAATREISREVGYYTVKHGTMKSDDADLVVPERMLGMQGLSHHIIDCQQDMQPEFAELLDHNVRGAHAKHGPAVEGVFQEGWRAVSVKGNAAEIARRFYWPRNEIEVTPTILARLVGLEGGELARAAFSGWLNEMQTSGIFNYNLLDLFYWEQRMPCWQGMSQSEYDIAMDSFTPFNCRGLLQTLLAVDRSERSVPDYHLFRSLIERMWPELLEVPINPQKRRGLGSRALRKIARIADQASWRFGLGTRYRRRRRD